MRCHYSTSLQYSLTISVQLQHSTTQIHSRETLLKRNVHSQRNFTGPRETATVLSTACYDFQATGMTSLVKIYRTLLAAPSGSPFITASGPQTRLARRSSRTGARRALPVNRPSLRYLRNCGFGHAIQRNPCDLQIPRDSRRIRATNDARDRKRVEDRLKDGIE